MSPWTGLPRKSGDVPSQIPMNALQHDRRAERRDDDDVDGPSPQRRVREPLEHQPDHEQDEDRHDVARDQPERADPEGAVLGREPVRDVGAEADERTLGEVHDPGGLVRDQEPDRRDRGDRTLGQTARQERHERAHGPLPARV